LTDTVCFRGDVAWQRRSWMKSSLIGAVAPLNMARKIMESVSLRWPHFVSVRYGIAWLETDIPRTGVLETYKGRNSSNAMQSWFRRRYLDLLGSIYIYNEHRGYTAVDRVLEAVRARAPHDSTLIAAIEKHRADERKHYLMFRRWFELRGVMPFALDRAYGHIDRFVEIMFGRGIDALDTEMVIESDELFARLARVISLTEQRGYRQVHILLDHPIVQADKVLTRMFRIIEKDEPSHWQPYDAWLERQGLRPPKLLERLVDMAVHAELVLLKLPTLFVNPLLRRRLTWPDISDPAGPLIDNSAAQPLAR